MYERIRHRWLIRQLRLSGKSPQEIEDIQAGISEYIQVLREAGEL
jgi:hypothetical protein